MFTKKQKDDEEALVHQYETFVNEQCLQYWERLPEEKKAEIEKKIEEKITRHDFVKKNKSIETVYRETTRIDILKEMIDITPIEEWKKNRNL